MTKLQLLHDDVAYEESQTYGSGNWIFSPLHRMRWTPETLASVINKQVSEELFEAFEESDVASDSTIDCSYSTNWQEPLPSTRRKSIDSVDKRFLEIFEQSNPDNSCPRSGLPLSKKAKPASGEKADPLTRSFDELNKRRISVLSAFMCLFAMCEATQDGRKRLQMNGELQKIIPLAVFLVEHKGVQAAAPLILAQTKECARVVKRMLEER